MKPRLPPRRGRGCRVQVEGSRIFNGTNHPCVSVCPDTYRGVVQAHKTPAATPPWSWFAVGIHPATCCDPVGVVELLRACFPIAVTPSGSGRPSARLREREFQRHHPSVCIRVHPCAPIRIGAWFKLMKPRLPPRRGRGCRVQAKARGFSTTPFIRVHPCAPIRIGAWFKLTKHRLRPHRSRIGHGRFDASQGHTGGPDNLFLPRPYQGPSEKNAYRSVSQGR